MLQDIPRRHYSEWREAEDKPVFIKTMFELTPEVVKQVVALSNAIPENVKIVEVSRDFDGTRFIAFPNATTASGIPLALLEFGIDKFFRAVDDEAFKDVYDPKQPIINQIQQFATKHRVTLPGGGGWKVELAKQTKTRLLQRGRRNLTDNVIAAWTALFQKFQ